MSIGDDHRKTYLLIIKRKLNILTQYSIAFIEMSGRQAKVLSDQQIEDLLVYTSTTRNPERNRVIVLLSVKAGLRAGEIAKLTWDMVLDPTGEVGSVIELRDRVAKKNSGRLIPLHSEFGQLCRPGAV
jgi:integrase